jgi:hypothetical protein
MFGGKRLLAAVVALLSLGSLAACGSSKKASTVGSTSSSSSTSTTSSSSSSSSSSTTAAGPPRCHTSGLSAALGQSQGAAGHLVVEIRLTNTGAATCRVQGYLGFGLEGAGGATLPSTVVRGATFFGPDPGSKPVLLAPGKTAVATLAWSDVPTDADKGGPPCAAGVTALLVTPPDETTSLSVAFTGGVCNNGRLDTSALHLPT